MASGIATNFRLLTSLFDDRMSGLYRASASRPPGDAETEQVKTYLLELTEHSLPDKKLRTALRDLFTTAPTQSFKSLKVEFSEQDRLLQVTGRLHGRRLSAYVDFRDARFLRLHSTTQSDAIDALVQGWTGRLAELDHGWFDDSFLDGCSQLGEFRGIGIEFNNAPLTVTEDEDAAPEDRAESIRLRQSGRAQDMLTLLRESSTFSEQSSLSMVRIKYPRKASEQVTAEVRFDGRISGRGHSFNRHSEIAEAIINRYRSRIERVEKRYSMSATSLGSGYRLTGSPVVIDLSPSITDLSLFCKRVFSAVNPFRLAGIPRRIADDHFIVRAVDLHTSQTLRFELRPHRIWVFLPEGTCGNTLLRFVTNLQRHHSRLTRVSEGWDGTDAL